MGICPIEYVRMLRLGEVRSQLFNDIAGKRTISEIALDAGFSHLSQFVVDYKRAFGETPSTTRRRTLRSYRLDCTAPLQGPFGGSATPLATALIS
jgi:AraC-like DNA-binding protein